MAFLDGQMISVFSWDIFRQIANSDQVSLGKLNLFTAMLINSGIPYDLSYVSGTRKEAPAIQLTIHINPSATLVLVIALAPGSTVFAPSP